MTRPAAAATERAYLDAMIRILGLKVDGEPVKRERPDFLLTLHGGRTAGVELVRALDQHIAGGRGARQRLKQKLKGALASKGINAWVNVRLSEHTAAALNKDRVGLEAEVEAIVKLAENTLKNDPEPKWSNFRWIDRSYEELMGRRRQRDNDVQDLEGTGVEYADSVGVHPWSEPHASWSLFGGGQRSTIVQKAINSKVDDLPVYRLCGAQTSNGSSWSAARALGERSLSTTLRTSSLRARTTRRSS